MPENSELTMKVSMLEMDMKAVGESCRLLSKQLQVLERLILHFHGRQALKELRQRLGGTA